MNKKVLLGVAAFAIAAVSVFNVNFNSQKSNNLSGVSLANVEALAIEIGSSGNYVVTPLGPHSWQCDSGGGVCCPDFYSEKC
ncbi:hypothetical protein FACS189426_16850 [Bacteroidia bacterium]|nr:hypothetical protein FACS189426_16850 [Bacteroidia bacterium]